MNKIIKKMSLMIPPIKRQYENIVQLRSKINILEDELSMGGGYLRSDVLLEMPFLHQNPNAPVYDIFSIEFADGFGVSYNCGKNDPQIYLGLSKPLEKPCGIPLCEITYTNSVKGEIQLFWDYGEGLNEENSTHRAIKATTETESVFLRVKNWKNNAKLTAFRLDPPNGSKFVLKGIKISVIYGDQVNALESETEYLSGQVTALNAELGRSAYKIDLLDKLHEDAVQSAWDEKNKRKEWICIKPFTHMHLCENGDVFTCCPDWLKDAGTGYSIGNFFSDSFENIWNSDKVKRLRYSVSQGNFEYCTRKCPSLMYPSLYPYMQLRLKSGYHYNKWQDCSLNTTPTSILTSIDRTCNLYCLTCRNQIVSTSDSEREKTTLTLKNFVYPALRNCKVLTLDGNGEFLASKPYTRFLQTITRQEFPSLRLEFMTNGQLFTHERWEQFSNLKGIKITVGISIDAASKDLYEKLRRGAKWETLCNNMEYVASLKAQGDIDYTIMRFVVQKGNFHQLEDFVSLAKKWRVDNVHFQRLINYGISPQAFAEQDVFSPSNPLHEEAIRIMTMLTHETKDIRVTEAGCLA